MNIIPIKLERATAPRTTKIVEWRLSNVCNFNCSFCPNEFKDGSKRPLSLENYIKIVDNLIDQSNGKNVWFQFSGGEPTLYPKLIELLSHIKNRGGYTSLLSNGSRTLRFWQDLADKNVLNRLFLSYHPEQENSPNHIIAVNEIMQKTDTLVTMFVTTQTDPSLFQKALAGHLKILAEATAISTLKVIGETSTSIQPYSKDQLSIIQNNLYVRSPKWKLQSPEKFNSMKSIPYYDSEMILEFSDGSKRKNSAQEFVNHGLTQFKDWECDVGKDLMIIEIDEVFRSVCRQGGPIFKNLEEDVSWMTDSIICQKENCNCSLDVQEPKRKINT